MRGFHRESGYLIPNEKGLLPLNGSNMPRSHLYYNCLQSQIIVGTNLNNFVLIQEKVRVFKKLVLDYENKLSH